MWGEKFFRENCRRKERERAVVREREKIKGKRGLNSEIKEERGVNLE